ncbi:MAG: VWA domain-containing protein [Akkermansiaceae bacterium]|nr:VWA domain-containing protein [Akkermansiaceae bacterium]
MIFAHKYLLFLLPLVVIGAVLLYRVSKARARKKLSAFSPATRLPAMLRSVDFRAKKRKFILVTVALSLLVVALARPMWGPRDSSKEQEGAEFFIILDVSKSMLVRDVKPSRLDSVKASLAEWFKTRSGDRIGLILMAGDAFIQAPLTNDYTALREVLEHSRPKSISLGGTNISEAIKVAGKALDASGVKNKAVVIVSDGENTEGHTVTDVQAAHVNERIKFFTVGVGTPEGGQVPNKELPPDFQGPVTEIVKDEYGLPVTSKLDERNLRAIAAAGGGRYFDYLPEGKTWDLLYNQSLSTLAKKSAVFKLEDFVDLFQIPLLLAILLLAAEVGISTRLKNPPRPKSAVTLPEPSPAPAAKAMETTKYAPLAIALLFALAGSSWGAEADPLIARTEGMLREGKAAEAASMLREAVQKRPQDHYLIYNYGIAAYAAQQYQEAADAFSEVCLSKDRKLRGQALTQLGNTHYRIGQTVSKSWNRNGAVVAWERAVEYYHSANEEKPTKTTEKNLLVAKQQLEKLLLDIGDKSVIEAEKAQAQQEQITEPDKAEKNKPANLNVQVSHLTKAHEAYEKVTNLNPENKDAEKKLDEVTENLAEKLTEQARMLRERSEKVPEGKNQKAEQDKLNVQASQSYEKARALQPDDKPLAQEHDAFKKEVADKMTDTAQEIADQAMQPKPEAPKMGDLKKKQEGLQKALEQTNKALAFDDQNQRAQNLQAEVMKNLEETHMALAEMAMDAGNVAEERKQVEGAAENFNGAMQNFQKALAINPDNAEAEKGAAEAQEKLARNMAEIGKKEMAKVGQEPQPAKKGQTPPPVDPVSRLREDIGHLEKAAQNFAQADALAPGENEAQELHEQATEQLTELRSQLDKAQAQAGNQPKPPGEEAGEQQAAEQPGEPQDSQQPGTPMQEVKAMASFSEVRGSSDLEGQYKDLRDKRKIRDW